MIALISAALPSTPARADRQADAASIRGAYSDFDESFKRLDADAVTALFTPDYQGVDEHGKAATLAQTRAGMAALFRALSTPVHDVSNTLSVVRSSIQSLQVSGDTATARVTEHVGWTERGVLVPAIFQEHALTATDRDTWKRTADGWKIVRSRVLSARVTQGPLRGKVEAMARLKMQGTEARASQTMEIGREMSRMRDDQFNESMYRSHMNEIDREINRLPR